MSNDYFLSDEDKALFREAMKEVVPGKKNKRLDFLPVKPVPPQPKKPSPAGQETNIANSRCNPKNSIYLSDYYTEEVQSDSTLSYCSHAIPNKRFRELKNGKIPYQCRLDLHGLKPETAKSSLIHFIVQQQLLTHRCLLIIHGKGSRQGEAPILKNLVNHWLPQFHQVLAFHSAVARDGGTGAVYVLLKRTS